MVLSLHGPRPGLAFAYTFRLDAGGQGAILQGNEGTTMKMTTTALITALGTLLLAATASAEHGRYQTSNVMDASGAEKGYVGAAWLMRTEDAVRGRIMTQVSTAGDPYTLWIVVFNNPGACDGPCDGPDIGVANGSVYNGGGAISAPDGQLKKNGKPAGGGVVNIDFVIPAHPLPNGLFVLAGDPNGLYAGNGYAAEIHLVIDKHPPVGPGMSWIDDLTTTNFPNPKGPAFNDSFAVFVPCTGASCPDSVL